MTESLWKVGDLIYIFFHSHKVVDTRQILHNDVVLSIYGSVNAWVYPDTSCVGDLCAAWMDSGASVLAAVVGISMKVTV